MKKVLYVVMAVLLCVLLAMAAMADTAAPTTCQACGSAQEWEVMPSSWKTLTAGHYHYYLDKDVTPGQLVTAEGVTGITVCLDLNGHSINTNGRAIIARGVVNIMDSSAAESGYICGSTGTNNTASGSLAAVKGGTLRIYSGTMKFQKDDVGTGLGKGGVIGIENGGVAEIYGGKIEGGAPDKVLYYRCPDDMLRGFRVHAGDLLLVVPATKPEDGQLMLVQYKGQRFVRKLLKMDGGRIQMQAFDYEFSSVTGTIMDVKVLGRCVKLLRTL